jgi:hypothetical protein
MPVYPGALPDTNLMFRVGFGANSGDLSEENGAVWALED